MKSSIEYNTTPGEGVYIAGPMRGLPGNNEAEFFAAERKLVALGLLVLNPLRISRSIAPDEVLESSPSFLHTIMEIEKTLIKHCTYIYLLRGWETSAGAKGELAFAINNGVRVMLQAEDNP